ncbi:MAG: hypothetical protein M4D80_02475 [Myxococcota bacterium]|nr:hypothetical protein [Myxococcota bacterium]
MQAWAAVAIAQAALIAISLWRVSNHEGRSVWWPGAALFTVCALALLVLVRGDGYWVAVAIFGTIVLASDALLLDGQLVTSLCTREAKEPAA